MVRPIAMTRGFAKPRRSGPTASRCTPITTATHMGIVTAGTDAASRAAGGAGMRMLPLLFVFALFAAGIGYALAVPAAHAIHGAPPPPCAS
ncbi:protein of unknown function [Methylorubrum extorquens DM4]|uniref:Uncharacterized protein n=2 Tax=Methylorubrum extorquens TaxID=408 RepID=C7CEB0_METED|nr:protein of unknown function [Methylorubrum extorquens DM4]